MSAVDRQRMLYELAEAVLGGERTRISAQLGQERAAPAPDQARIEELQAHSTAVYLEFHALWSDDEPAVEAFLRKYAQDPARLEQAIQHLRDVSADRGSS